MNLRVVSAALLSKEKEMQPGMEIRLPQELLGSKADSLVGLTRGLEVIYLTYPGAHLAAVKAEVGKA